MSLTEPTHDHSDTATPDDVVTDAPGDTETLPTEPLLVRRSSGLAAALGGAGSAIAIGYLWRASQTGNAVDWLLCGVMAVIGIAYLTQLLDSRTPLLVADDLGVRIRLGDEWRGLPWEAVDDIVVTPRRGLLHDGSLIISPRNPARALDGLDVRGRRQARLNRRLYGAALAVPVGLTTRVVSGADGLVEGLSTLAAGRAGVVVPEEGSDAAPTEVASSGRVAATSSPGPDSLDTPSLDTPTLDSPGPDSPRPDARSGLSGMRRARIGTLGMVVSRMAKGRAHDIDSTEPPHPLDEPSLPDAPAARAVVPLRDTRSGARAEVTVGHAGSSESTARLLDPHEHAGIRSWLPEGRELRRPGSVDLVFEQPASPRVRPISELGDPVEALVVEDFVPEPAYDPVIGPQLAAARNRVSLSVDQLAERTRIRPHVIESIEVDDFAPCGGDFYARGHLRTLARVLGQDAGPLIERFDDLYATAPIDARRVFEAELATGMTGSMRRTAGGPNWGLLVGVVLSLILVWGVVRLISGDTGAVIEGPAPVLNGSAGVQSQAVTPVTPAKPVPVTLVAAHGATSIVVSDGTGKVIFTGDLALGQQKQLRVRPPVRVRATDAGAVEVQMDGRDRGVLGELGQPGRRTFEASR